MSSNTCKNNLKQIEKEISTDKGQLLPAGFVFSYTSQPVQTTKSLKELIELRCKEASQEPKPKQSKKNMHFTQPDSLQPPTQPPPTHTFSVQPHFQPKSEIPFTNSLIQSTSSEKPPPTHSFSVQPHFQPKSEIQFNNSFVQNASSEQLQPCQTQTRFISDSDFDDDDITPILQTKENPTQSFPPQKPQQNQKSEIKELLKCLYLEHSNVVSQIQSSFSSAESHQNYSRLIQQRMEIHRDIEAAEKQLLNISPQSQQTPSSPDYLPPSENPNSFGSQTSLQTKNVVENKPQQKGFLSTSSSEDEDVGDVVYLYENEADKQISVPPDRYNQMQEINHSIFHHRSFRGVQVSAISYALDNKDVFVLMPTER
jgi:hypothetical protein